MLHDIFTFVDIETTGARVNYDRIIEIGIIRVEKNEVVTTYETLLNPETYVSPFIEQMTGINSYELSDAPTFDNKKDEILELLEGSIFVAHNVRFDYGFIRNEFRRYGINYTSKHLCTAKLSRVLFPQYPRHNLDSIIERFNFICEARHRAYGDAKILWDFFKAIQNQFPSTTLETSIKQILKKPSLPVHLTKDLIDALPTGPGVYIFYGENEIPLYIGKSKHIKERVLSHFNSDLDSSKEMNISQQIKRIETVETAGELGALFKESQLVKEMQPLYNRKLRNARVMTYIMKGPNKNGYNTVTIEPKDKIDIAEINSILGTFRSTRQAKDFLNEILKEHNLCEHLLTLSKGKGACFAHKLDICKGACQGTEDSNTYNSRFDEAFRKRALKTWPFRNPVVITEYNEILGKNETFVIDKWCLLGTFENEDYIDFSSITNDYRFDLDTYKILIQYIFNTENKNRIKELQILQTA